jgi:uncharacterized protein YycO
MKTTIEITALRKADIIVSTTNANISKAIRQAIGSDFSHTMLYKGSGWIIEAIEQGVIERPWSEASAEATLAIALRRRNMSDAQRDAVVANALGFKERPYDKVGAAGAGMYKKRGAAITSGLVFGGCIINPTTCGLITSGKTAADIAVANNASDKNKDNAFFCSELVARAYQLAGVPLADGVEPSFMNPREVRMSSKLIYIGHLIG